MDLYGLLREVTRRRVTLLFVLALGILAAVATAYQLPSLEKRSLSIGAATGQILVDSERSTLVAGAGPEQISALGTRARVYAQYLSSRDAVDRIAADSGIPERLIMARGPFSLGTGISNYDQQPAESRAKDLVDEDKRFRLVFEAQEDVPIVTVYATGPSAPDAVKLTGAAFNVLREYVAELKALAKDVPESPRADPKLPNQQPSGTIPVGGADDVVVRQLGAPEGGTVGGHADIVLMLLAFLGVVGLSCLVVALFARLRQQRYRHVGGDDLAADAMVGLHEAAPGHVSLDGDDAAGTGGKRRTSARRRHAGVR